LGALKDSGYLARNERILRHLTQTVGLKGYSTKQALGILEALLVKDIAQVGAFEIDWQRYANNVRLRSRFEDVLKGEPRGHASASEILAALRGAPGEERKAIILDYLLRKIGKVTGASCVNPSAELTDLGLDSLMGFELKTTIDSDLGISIAPERFLHVPSIDGLADVILGLMLGPGVK